VRCVNGGEWPEARFGQQVFLAFSGLLFLACGRRALRRNRPRWIGFWAAGLLGWATIPKYFICTRCENYGKPCDFFYGGRYAAIFFKGQPDKPFNAAGYFAEGTTLAVFGFLPAIAAWKDAGAVVSYALSAMLFQAALITVCCVKCVRRATDPWKRAYCPTFQLTERVLRLLGT
jgi:hypothetical protein